MKPGHAYPVDEAVALVKEFASAKFDETVDVAINLGIDPAKSDQQVRGSTVMPNGTGKKVRVAVFTQGKNADAAREAGADIVGLEDLAEKVKAGQMDFDVVVASPDAMRVVGGLGQILGPRGLMPNPKVGTVTPDVAGAVQEREGGPGPLPLRQGRASSTARSARRASTPEALKENLLALIADIQKHKPSTSKGVFLQRVSVSSTMGPGVGVDRATLELGRPEAGKGTVPSNSFERPGWNPGHRRPQAGRRPLNGSLRRWWNPSQLSLAGPTARRVGWD